jgi:uncharacterized membrane protein
MTTISHSSTCAVCALIEAADAAADAAFAARSTKNSNELVRAAMRAQDIAADKITNFAGSLRFVYLHGVWFFIWIAINTGIVFGGLAFDTYPFGLLTMIVSLEAIFLSTFVMVSQNRQARRESIRGELDFETNIRAEVWALHIGAALKIDPDHVEHAVQTALDNAREAQERGTATYSVQQVQGAASVGPQPGATSPGNVARDSSHPCT